MNKKQLISIIRTEVLLAKSSPERKGYIAGLEEAINIIEGFSDESQKPVVPQFVADWIELCKKSTRSLRGAMHYAKGTDVERWLIASDNQETFARAWLDGYTVEEEAKYKVKFKGISGNINCLNHNSKIQKWYLASNYETDIVRTKFTRKELEEAGFGEVFNSPLFEVEEVE